MGGQLALPGFGTVLRRIAQLWRSNKGELQEKVGC